MAKLSRRDFLKGSTSLAAGSVLDRWFRPLPAAAAATQGFPSVSVADGSSEDTPAQILQTALAGLGGIGRFVKPGQTVAIKPNATWAYPPHTASSTDPDFLTALIQAVRDAGAGRIIVMDHCSIEPGAEPAVRISGIGKVVKDMGVESLFPDRYDAPPSTYTKINLPNGRANQSIGVIKAAVEVDVRINLAVAKTHNVAAVTMCLKHMMGFLQQPGRLHSNLEQGIADLSTPSSPVQAQLHILEAIRVRMPHGSYRVCAGPETDLTHPQIVARRNMAIAGTDPVLIDAFGCVHLFDMQPQELAYVLRAHESGCGDIDVDAALADGRIRRFPVGASSIATPAAAVQPAGNPASVPASGAPHSPASRPTAVYLSDSGPVGGSLAAAPAEVSSSAPGQVIAPDPLLKFALIPVAAVLTGLGLAILNRMRRRLPAGGHTETSTPQIPPGDSTSDEGRD